MSERANLLKDCIFTTKRVSGGSGRGWRFERRGCFPKSVVMSVGVLRPARGRRKATFNDGPCKREREERERRIEKEQEIMVE